MNPEIIERMIEQGRDTYEARLAAGQARLKAGDAARAREHLEKATGHKPEQAMAWQELGKALNELGRPEAARIAWQSGLASARSNGDKQAEKVMTVFLKRLERLEND